jgi:hypothetical protein
MKQRTFHHLTYTLLNTSLAFSMLLLGSCSPAEIADVQAAEQAALNALSANKSLAEQFVKDVKRNVDKDDPQYESIQATYERARDEYNQYLSRLQATIKSGRSDHTSADSIEHLNHANTEFVSSAARGLDPSANNNRRLDYEKAIVIPSLPPSARKLSRDARGLLADKIITDARWQPWSQLQ